MGYEEEKIILCYFLQRQSCFNQEDDEEIADGDTDEFLSSSDDSSEPDPKRPRIQENVSTANSNHKATESLCDVTVKSEPRNGDEFNSSEIGFCAEQVKNEVVQDP